MIRPAEHRDIPVLQAMIADFMTGVEELEEAGLFVDQDTLEFFVQDYIDVDERCVLVAEIDGEIIGAIAGGVAPWWGNANIITLIEMGWYVPLANRSKYPVAAMGLKKKFRAWGKEQGATVLIMTSTVREESPRVIKHYEKDGLKRIDNNFIGRLR